MARMLVQERAGHLPAASDEGVGAAWVRGHRGGPGAPKWPEANSHLAYASPPCSALTDLRSKH